MRGERGTAVPLSHNTAQRGHGQSVAWWCLSRTCPSVSVRSHSGRMWAPHPTPSSTQLLLGALIESPGPPGNGRRTSQRNKGCAQHFSLIPSHTASLMSV